MIEILQDGAALLESKSSHQWIYTRSVESCAVHAFLGDKASLFVHDTGQLSTNSIKNLVEKCGKLRRCLSVLNSLCLEEDGVYQQLHGKERRQRMLASHERRRSELRAKAKISVRWDLVWIGTGDIATSTEGRVSAIPPDAPLLPVPERQRRHAVLMLNNAFAEPNAQDLKVDLQFKGGKFTLAPALARSYDEMLRIADAKQALGDPDFHTFLREQRVAFDVSTDK